MTPKSLLTAAAQAAMVLTLLAAGSASSQTTTRSRQAYPTKPIRVVLPFAPGGSTDTLMRILAPKLGESLGQTIIIDNRGGGGGNIGAEIVARSAPDGYTIFVASAMLTTNKSLYSKLTYDPERDFAPVTHLATGPYLVVVHPSLPAKTISDVIALAKAKPGALHFGSSGVGGASHLAGELFKRRAGVEMVHVAYKGGGPAAAALLAGEAKAMVGSVASTIAFVKAGRLRALATTGAKHSRLLPELPTIAESGYPGFEVTVWFAFLVPAATPKNVVDRIRTEAIKAMQPGEVQAAMARQGLEPETSTPAELAARVKAEAAMWSAIIKDLGIRAE